MPISDDTIDAMAVLPQKSVVDGQEVQERPLADLMAQQDASIANLAVAKKGRGLRFTKIIPSGPA